MWHLEWMTVSPTPWLWAHAHADIQAGVYTCVCVCVLVGLNSHWNVDSVFLMKSIMQNNPIPFCAAIPILSARALHVNEGQPLYFLLLATLRPTKCRKHQENFWSRRRGVTITLRLQHNPQDICKFKYQLDVFLHATKC